METTRNGNHMKIIALFSGGLDSLLAILLCKEQELDVIALHINIGFDASPNKAQALQAMADRIHVPLSILDRRQKYLDDILFSPKYGYGKNFNPCIDCHAFMFREALEYMKEQGASFVVTGEVVNERPMSQRKQALSLVDRLSGDSGLIVRPLSAKLLPETIPEKQGLIDRSRLLDISGRSRTRQIELAKQYGIDDYPSPGGGCLLTDENFSKKLKDLSTVKKITPDDPIILKSGRYFVLPDGARLIIARNEAECNVLENYPGDDFIKLLPIDFTGPSALIKKGASQSDTEIACQKIITYSKMSKGKVLGEAGRIYEIA
jgi:tRNA-specific 2-thiouridylase